LLSSDNRHLKWQLEGSLQNQVKATIAQAQDLTSNFGPIWKHWDEAAEELNTEQKMRLSPPLFPLYTPDVWVYAEEAEFVAFSKPAPVIDRGGSVTPNSFVRHTVKYNAGNGVIDPLSAALLDEFGGYQGWKVLTPDHGIEPISPSSAARTLPEPPTLSLGRRLLQVITSDQAEDGKLDSAGGADKRRASHRLEA
jgi:hypothetical protein